MPAELTRIAHPFLYEINTWPWLAAISKTEGKAIDLGSVPARYWDQIADLGFDGVWLMGVWRRSSAGITIALANDQLRASFGTALPNWQHSDVVGSPTAYAAMSSMIISGERPVSPPRGRLWRYGAWD
jgi:hypothetical protein